MDNIQKLLSELKSKWHDVICGTYSGELSDDIERFGEDCFNEGAKTMANLDAEISNDLRKSQTTLMEKVDKLQWIEGIPKDTKTYQVCFTTSNGIQRTTRAKYIRANTILMQDFFDEDSLDDMENIDTAMVPEGWYEHSWTTNQTHIISEKITHYQELPTLPNLDNKGEIVT